MFESKTKFILFSSKLGKNNRFIENKIIEIIDKIYFMIYITNIIPKSIFNKNQFMIFRNSVVCCTLCEFSM